MALFAALIAASYPATQEVVRLIEDRIDAARERAGEARRLEEEAALWEEGRQEAERDLAAGVLRVRCYGYVGPWVSRARDIHRRRFGVEIDWVAGCMVPEDVRLRAAGYNARMMAEIDRRFGPGALDAAWEQAGEEHRTEYEKRAATAHAEGLPDGLWQPSPPSRIRR